MTLQRFQALNHQGAELQEQDSMLKGASSWYRFSAATTRPSVPGIGNRGVLWISGGRDSTRFPRERLYRMAVRSIRLRETGNEDRCNSTRPPRTAYEQAGPDGTNCRDAIALD